MTKTPTARRAPSRPTGRKTANRFAALAGGVEIDGHDDDAIRAAGDAAGGGLIGGLSALDAATANRIVNLPTAEIAPHPFNDPARSEPQSDDPKWDELLNGVRSVGVRLPVLVVPRQAFLAARPDHADLIDPAARYVLIYGHRRRAAAAAVGRETIPAVVDDEIMANNGDLDAMAVENLGRQDLSDFAEADMFARFSDIGLSQRAIAERLGVAQGTVSRRLALLLLTPEVREAVETGAFASADAAGLAGRLPYGPTRGWQKSADPDQNTAQRLAEQNAAYGLVANHGWLGTRAAERVIAEREARQQAASMGIEVVDDIVAELGPGYLERSIGMDQCTPGREVIAAINPATGHLNLYDRTAEANPAPAAEDAIAPAPEPSTSELTGQAPTSIQAEGEGSGDEDTDDEAEQVEDIDPIEAKMKAAQAMRRQACATLITLQPTNAELLKTLVGQVLSGVSARSRTSAVAALLRDWDAYSPGEGEKARNLQAWHIAIASAELHLADLKAQAWDGAAVAHIEMLINRTGYQPTPWEREQLESAR